MAQASADSIRVLHVDDTPSFAEMAAEFLEHEDDRFVVETATSAGEGLDHLADGDVDCIVSDFDMPRQNGIELFETVRDEHPDLPFILFTGKGSEEVASEAISAGVTDYLQKEHGTEQYELLANRIKNAVRQHRAQQRAVELDRIRVLINDINQALVHAESHAEAETRICEIISESEPYLFAWIGEHDAEARTIEPRTGAGVEQGYLDTIEITTDESPTGRGPTARAVRTRELAVIQNIPETPEYDPWRDEALERGYRSSAAVPLVCERTLYGVLNVYADRTEAFDERERELLTELGTTIAHAFYSFDVRAELREERDRFATLFDTLPNPVVRGRLEEGQAIIRDVNPAFEDTFGYDRETVTGDPLHDLFRPDANDREMAVETAKQRLRTDGEVQTDVRRETTDGVREFRVTVTVRNPQAETPEGYAIYTDITEREELAEELREKSTLLEQLFEQAPTHLYVKDTEGRHLWVSDHLVDPGALLGKTDREAYPEEFSEATFADDRRVIDEGEPILNTVERSSHDDAWNLTSKVPWYGDDGEIKGLIGVTRRITHHKEYERELERQNERLETFASVVSHDLRNPLNVAEGRLELAREECDSEHLLAIADAHARMETLIENLLTLAQQGRSVDETAAVDLGEITERCWRNVETAAATLVTETNRTIRADRERLQALLENLIRNAVEYGGQDVTITVGDLDDPAGFYVADDGPGIPEELRDTVFESGYSTIEDGTGFGLAIVTEIVEAHGWEISISGSEDGGARFAITGVELIHR